PGVYVHHARMPEKGNVNSCVDFSIYAGMTADRRGRVVLDLLSLIVQEPFFDQLRTKEQLGYITYSTDRKYNGGHMTLRLLVQSEVSPAYVRMRLERFIAGFRARLVEMPQAKFDGYASSLRVAWEEKIKNLFEESGRLWRHVSSGQYEFDRLEQDIATLARVQKDELLGFWDRFVDRTRAPAFTGLVATIWSTKITQPSEQDLARYADAVLALHGSMEHDGARGLSFAAVEEFIGQLAPDDGDEDGALERLVDLYVGGVEDPEGEDAVKAVAKMRKPASYVRTAIAMAREEHAACAAKSDLKANGEAKSVDDDGLYNVGAVKTPAGDWVFRESSAFRATLRQSGAAIPSRLLKPKY
ncbi:metalloprotease, partial [Coemansia erecta]